MLRGITAKSPPANFNIIGSSEDVSAYTKIESVDAVSVFLINIYAVAANWFAVYKVTCPDAVALAMDVIGDLANPVVFDAAILDRRDKFKGVETKSLLEIVNFVVTVAIVIYLRMC